MSNFAEYVNFIKEIKRQHEIISRRYYNRESESHVLDLIIEELNAIPKEYKLPKEIFYSLLSLTGQSSMNIQKLCKIYRELILINQKIHFL